MPAEANFLDETKPKQMIAVVPRETKLTGGPLETLAGGIGTVKKREPFGGNGLKGI